MNKNEKYIISFGRAISHLRQKNKMTQEHLADLSDLHRTFISNIENGKKIPTLSSIISLSKSFNMSASDLLKIMEKIYDKK